MLAGAAPALLSSAIAACDAAAPPPSNLFNTDPEQYWAELLRQWLLAANRINVNSGALGYTPLPVLRATIDRLVSAAAFREPDNPWFDYAENVASAIPARRWPRSQLQARRVGADAQRHRG